MRGLAAGFLGAGVAFFLSSLLTGIMPAALSTMTVLKWLYEMGLLNPQVAWAGSFPDPRFNALATLLLILAGVCFVLAALLFLRTRRKPNL